MTTLLALGGAVGALVGLGLLANGRTSLGLFFLIGPPAASVVNFLLIKRATERQPRDASHRRGSTTGRTLMPVPAPPPGHDWTGGANLATDLGRVNATWPLAKLTVSEHLLAIHIRPKLLAGLLGATWSSWPPDQLLTLYPVRGKWFSFNTGIAIEGSSSPLAYFWTRRPADVLTVLARHGLPVDWTERSVTILP